MDLPRIGSYGEYSTGNYGVNCQFMEIGGITLYYSYSTIIGFRTRMKGLVLSHNVWGNTTGKHLNWLDRDKKNRLDYDDFSTQLKTVLKNKFNLDI